MTRRPAHTLHAHTNVAGKNHRFGIRFGWHEVREFGVQIVGRHEPTDASP